MNYHGQWMACAGGHREFNFIDSRLCFCADRKDPVEGMGAQGQMD